MANVSPVDGVKYGFRLMGYTIAVFLGGAIIAGIGAGMMDSYDSGSIVMGAIIAMFGAAIVYAGMLGMGYKIIADAVEKGVQAANDGTQADGFRSGNAQQAAAGRANRQQARGRSGHQQSGGGPRSAGGQRSSQQSGSQRSGQQRQGTSQQRQDTSQQRQGQGAQRRGSRQQGAGQEDDDGTGSDQYR